MGLALRWAYRIAIGPKPPDGVAQAARKRASARLLALIAKPRGRGAHPDWLCRTLLMRDHRLPLSFDAGVGCGQACGRGASKGDPLRHPPCWCGVARDICESAILHPAAGGARAAVAGSRQGAAAVGRRCRCRCPPTAASRSFPMSSTICFLFVICVLFCTEK